MKRDWTKAIEMALREAVMFHGYDQSLIGMFQQKPPAAAEQKQKPQKAQQPSLADLLGVNSDARGT